jgi:hypothetical protein
MRVLLTIIFLTVLSIFSSAQIVYKMQMDIQATETMVGRTCVEDSIVIWSMYQDTLHIIYLDKYLVYYALSRKEWHNLDEDVKKKFDNHLYKNTSDDTSYILRNRWREIYVVRFIVNKKKGVLIIMISEYDGGVPSYTFSFGTKNVCNY